MTDALLVRHGETRLNYRDRVQGWLPEPLNERGKRQAGRTGQLLDLHRDVDRIVTSDLRRARQTATIIAEHTDAEVTIDDRWREQHFGEFEGCPSEEFEAAIEDVGPTEPVAGGESLEDVRDRARQAWRDIAETDETVVVVAHAVTLAQLLGAFADIDLSEAVEEFSIDNASVVAPRHAIQDHTAYPGELVA